MVAVPTPVPVDDLPPVNAFGGEPFEGVIVLTLGSWPDEVVSRRLYRGHHMVAEVFRKEEN